MKIETEKYFRYLLDTVTEAGGTVQLGVGLTAKGVEEMKQSRHVVNCLGEYNIVNLVSWTKSYSPRHHWGFDAMTLWQD